MAKRVAILQSNYIPWKGYFDIIHDVDELIFLDDVQYTRQDWRNRNRIKTAQGVRWLTIPVGTDLNRRICDVELPADDWGEKHWRQIEQSYAAAPHFETHRDALEDFYLRRKWRTLSELNQEMIRTLSQQLGITTVFRDSREFTAQGRGQERVLELLQHAGANVYVSGPAAKAYIEPWRFDEAGIELRWKDYSGYPEYPQLYPPFVHEVTVLDLIFHTGPDAPWFIWGWR